MLRIIRAILIVLTTVTVAISAGICTVVYRLNNGAAEEAIERVSREAFGATAKLAGPVTVKPFPQLVVHIPAVRFVDPQSGRQMGSIESARLNVAMWSLPLGAIRVSEGVVTGAKGEITLNGVSIKSIFENSLGALTFPKGLRLGTMRFEQSELTVRVLEGGAESRYVLGNLSAGFEGLSPEMRGAVTWSADVRKVAAEEMLAANGQQPQTAQTEGEPAAGQDEEAPKASADVPKVVAEEAPAANDQLQTAQTEGAPAAGQAEESLKASPNATLRLPEWARAFEGFQQGLFNGSATLSLSASSRVATLENAQVSLQGQASEGKVLAAGRAVRFGVHGPAILVSRAALTIARPDRSPSDIRIDIEDMRYEKGVFQSPRSRIQLTEKSAERMTVVDLAGRLEGDVAARKLICPDFEGTVAVSGDPTLPGDFSARMKGVVQVDGEHAAGVDLKGQLAGAPVAFAGTLTAFPDKPTLRGRLSIGKLDFAALPAPRSMDWMQHFVFDGTVDLTNVRYRTFAARDLTGKLRLKDGVLTLEDGAFESAAGVVRVSGSINQHARWSASGRADALEVTALAALFGEKTPVYGALAGTFAAEGEGWNLKAGGTGKLSSGAYQGLDAKGVHDAILSGVDWSSTRSDEATVIQNASGTWSFADGVLRVENFSANSVDMRAEGAFAVKTAEGEQQGALQFHFPAMDGTPALSINGKLTGTVFIPVWQFDYAPPRAEMRKFRSLMPVREPEAGAAPESQPADEGDLAGRIEETVKDAWGAVKKLF
ncbi:MAG TPA: hypothetical protein DEO49_00020 [Sutterella sp.]|nr:hypothetical protein [Sutterella sp.]